jgi:hypothetical protein
MRFLEVARDGRVTVQPPLVLLPSWRQVITGDLLVETGIAEGHAPLFWRQRRAGDAMDRDEVIPAVQIARHTISEKVVMNLAAIATAIGGCRPSIAHGAVAVLHILPVLSCNASVGVHQAIQPGFVADISGLAPRSVVAR